jgi:osmotically-inducible protein OsmY
MDMFKIQTRNAVVCTLALGASLAACSPAEQREASNTVSQTAQKVEGAVDNAALTARVKGSFLADPQIKGLEINVDSQAGAVTLSGQVASPAEKLRAEELARGIDGVFSVQNNLITASTQ